MFVPPTEQIRLFFETTASGRKTITGIVLLMPLHAMQGCSLLGKIDIRHKNLVSKNITE